MPKTETVAESNGFSVAAWYGDLIEVANLKDTRQRYDSLVGIHQQTLQFYLPALASMTPEMAAQVSSDGRPRSLVVAHIMGWEEWQTQIFGDSDKEARLRRQMQLQGYYDLGTGKFVDFKDVNDFNLYNAHKYAGVSWPEIQTQAVITALKLQSFFPVQPDPAWLEFLNQTPVHSWKILPEVVINIPAGWYLWMVSLEHETVEHRNDLLGVK